VHPEGQRGLFALYHRRRGFHRRALAARGRGRLAAGRGRRAAGPFCAAAARADSKGKAGRAADRRSVGGRLQQDCLRRTAAVFYRPGAGLRDELPVAEGDSPVCARGRGRRRFGRADYDAGGELSGGRAGVRDEHSIDARHAARDQRPAGPQRRRTRRACKAAVFRCGAFARQGAFAHGSVSAVYAAGYRLRVLRRRGGHDRLPGPIQPEILSLGAGGRESADVLPDARCAQKIASGAAARGCDGD